MVKKSFIRKYFDGKTGKRLLSTITPDWSEENTQRHIDLVGCPEDAEYILEIGCGVGRLLNELDRPDREVVGIDASKSMIYEGDKIAKKNVLLFHCDGGGNIPSHVARENGYDFVFSIITFQHIPNTETVKKYISEMIRITKEGGEIMFQVLSEEMNRGELWSYHSLTELKDHLFELGFKDIKIEEHNLWTVFRATK